MVLLIVLLSTAVVLYALQLGFGQSQLEKFFFDTKRFFFAPSPRDLDVQQLILLAKHYDWPFAVETQDKLVGIRDGTQISLQPPSHTSADANLDERCWQLCFDAECLARFELLGLPPLEMKLDVEQRQQLVDRDVIWSLLNPTARNLLLRLNKQSEKLCVASPILLLHYPAENQSPTAWVQRITWGLALIEQIKLSLREGEIPKGLLRNAQSNERTHVQQRSLEILLQHYPQSEEARWAIRTVLARTPADSPEYERTLRLILEAYCESFAEAWCPPELSLAAQQSEDPELQLLGALASQQEGIPFLKKLAIRAELPIELRMRAMDAVSKLCPLSQLFPTFLALCSSEHISLRRHVLRHILLQRAQARIKKWPSFELIHQESLVLLEQVPLQTILEITDWLRQYSLPDDEVYQRHPPLMDNILYLLLRNAKPEQIIRLAQLFTDLRETAAEPLLLAWLQYEKVPWRDKDQEAQAKQSILHCLAHCGTIEAIEPIHTCLANHILPSFLKDEVRRTIIQIQERVSSLVSGNLPSFSQISHHELRQLPSKTSHAELKHHNYYTGKTHN